MSQGSAGSTGGLISGQYNLTPGTVTDGQQTTIQTDAQGRLLTVPAGTGTTEPVDLQKVGGVGVVPAGSASTALGAGLIPVTAQKYVSAAAAAMTRPADTNAYAAGDQISNSTTAASVVPLQFAVTIPASGWLLIDRATIRKSTSTVANAVFRLHLFNATPTIATTGDNGVFATTVAGASAEIGLLDCTTRGAYTDGANARGVPTDSPYVTLTGTPGAFTVYGMLEALAAYAPGNAEVFNVSIRVVGDLT